MQEPAPAGAPREPYADQVRGERDLRMNPRGYYLSIGAAAGSTVVLAWWGEIAGLAGVGLVAVVYLVNALLGFRGIPLRDREILVEHGRSTRSGRWTALAVLPWVVCSFAAASDYVGDRLPLWVTVANGLAVAFLCAFGLRRADEVLIAEIRALRSAVADPAAGV
ncbi:hypothetical protein [Georgenia faecalis]|uniref:Uncharacterized protein n=1 Tax=Georgenia faecalis TaxID=2483799 RepID=A0ABV9DA34_9MICO|nr:hypothetical protein [Georgenia faecalis]